MTHAPLVEIAAELRDALAGFSFASPVEHVYNPLEYAWAPHAQYLERWGTPPREIVFVGMNPGPWGMAQNGVPFGATTMVKGFLGIDAPVEAPEVEHPKRPIEGLELERDEVSGMRLWGWVKERWGTPDRFFERFFVHNYCPLCFMADTGRNVTPNKLKKAERDELFPLCDRALEKTIRVLGARRAIGVGAFATRRAKAALGDLDVEIGRVLHPSPASPKANRGWAEQAERELREQGIETPE